MIRTLALTLILGLVVSAPAAAEIRTGDATDPVGDSAGAPSQDIVSAHASYDTNGQISVSAIMNGDVASGPASFFSFEIASFSPPSSCAGASATLFGFTDNTAGLLKVTGYSGTGSTYGSPVGSNFGFAANATALQAKDYSCMTVLVTPKESGGTTLDRLDVPLWFTGYGPDTDGDGVKDTADKCPAAAASTPDGCPVAAAPAPAPVVKPPSNAAPATTKARPLTRAQKRAKALKACRKVKNKKKRAACVKRAKRRYPV